MDAVLRSQVDDEIEQLDIIIKASEDWSKSYQKDPKTHAKLIKNEAKMARALRGWLDDTAKSAVKSIDWKEYDRLKNAVTATQIKAAVNVKTIVTGTLFDDSDSVFMSIAFDYIATSTLLGGQAGESIYDVALGLTSTSDIIQSLTTNRIARLVGKVVDDNGNIVDNPNADYRISDVIRDQIKSSIQTSIDLGENRDDASSRLVDLIGNPDRADMIAQTESVNAYSSGLLGFGQESGATGKEWQDVGADDVCATNSDNSPIAIDDSFEDVDGSPIDGPVAHPNCRCGVRLLYANEYNPDDNTTE